MSELIQGTLILALYRVITIGCGLLIVYLGYRLFRVGVYEKAGELKAVWGERMLTLKQAAPGTFFAVFGAAVCGFSIWQGLDLERLRTSPGAGNPVAAGGAGAVVVVGGQAASAELVSAIKNASDGKALTAEEKKLLSGLISSPNSPFWQELIRLQAVVPKDALDKQLEKLGIRKDRPG